jgi:hypothetical protein
MMQPIRSRRGRPGPGRAPRAGSSGQFGNRDSAHNSESDRDQGTRSVLHGTLALVGSGSPGPAFATGRSGGDSRAARCVSLSLTGSLVPRPPCGPCHRLSLFDSSLKFLNRQLSGCTHGRRIMMTPHPAARAPRAAHRLAGPGSRLLATGDSEPRSAAVHTACAHAAHRRVI